MVKKTTFALVAIVALLGISNVLPGPSDFEAEEAAEQWKEIAIELAKKDLENERAEAAFANR